MLRDSRGAVAGRVLGEEPRASNGRRRAAARSRRATAFGSRIATAWCGRPARRVDGAAEPVRPPDAQHGRDPRAASSARRPQPHGRCVRGRPASQLHPQPRRARVGRGARRRRWRGGRGRGRAGVGRGLLICVRRQLWRVGGVRAQPDPARHRRRAGGVDDEQHVVAGRRERAVRRRADVDPLAVHPPGDGELDVALVHVGAVGRRRRRDEHRAGGIARGHGDPEAVAVADRRRCRPDHRSRRGPLPSNRYGGE